MFVIPKGKRHEYWNHFIARWVVEKVGGGAYVTGPKLRKIWRAILDDDEFWLDVVARHGGLRQTPESMQLCDPDTYNHCLGNFWGMVYQTLVERGLVKR